MIERVFSAKDRPPPHNLGHAVACRQQQQQRADSSAHARVEQPYHVPCFTRGGGGGDAPCIERGRPPASPAASRCASIEWRTPCSTLRRISRTRAVCPIDWCIDCSRFSSGAVYCIGPTVGQKAPQLPVWKQAFWSSCKDQRRGVMRQVRASTLPRAASAAQGCRSRRRSCSCCCCSSCCGRPTSQPSSRRRPAATSRKCVCHSPRLWQSFIQACGCSRERRFCCCWPFDYGRRDGASGAESDAAGSIAAIATPADDAGDHSSGCRCVLQSCRTGRVAPTRDKHCPSLRHACGG